MTSAHVFPSLRAGSTGFLRGYKVREISGNQFHLLNAEYRQEIWRIERGVGPCQRPVTNAR